MYKVFLYTLLLAAPFVHSDDDTYGTHFVTSVLNYPNPDFSDSCTVNFIFHTKAVNSVALIRLSNINMNVQFVNINGGGGSINLDCKYFLFNNYNGMNQLYTIPDNRIIITSDNPIKVLVQVNFGNFNGQTIGDMYLVYPDFLLGNKYKVKLPKSSNGTPGLISLMALDNGPPIRGFITQYKNGSIASVNQFILAGAVGERQAIFVSDSSDQDISYTIVANREFVVVANVPCVDLSFASGNAASDSTSACDYSAFTLLPIQNYDCHSYLDGNGDIKGISSQFTNYIYELPNAVECSSNLLVFNNLKYRVTTQDKVSVNMGKSISINSKSSDGFSSRSTYTKIRTTRLGGNRDSDSNMITSAFLTNIPDMSQTITGYVPFYNTIGGSSLEVCGNDINPDNFRINDVKIPNELIKRNFFPNAYQYSCYVIQVQVNLFNTFYSDGNYLAYICGNNVNSQSSYGYSLGFSVSMLTSTNTQKVLNPGGDGLNTYPTTTTTKTEAPTTSSTTTTTTTTKTTTTTTTVSPKASKTSKTSIINLLTTPTPLMTTTKSSEKVENSLLICVFSLIFVALNL